MVAQTNYLRDPRVRRAAEALADAGYDVDVFSLRERSQPRKTKLHGVSLTRLPVTRKRGSKARYLFEYLLFTFFAGVAISARHLRRRYSLVYVHNLPDSLVLAGVVSKMLGARIILDLHDPMPETLMSKYMLSHDHAAVRLARAMERWALRFADKAITVHDPLRRLFVERGADPSKIEVVMNLTDLTEIRRRQLSPSETKPGFALVYAGTVSHRYGLDLALEAVAALRQEIPRICLRIIGEGDQLNDLRSLVHRLGLSRYVELIEPVDHEQVWRFYQAADVGISPHRPDELFKFSLSNKVYEYVAFGLPAIVPRTECLEFYYPENVVCFFRPGDVGDLTRVLLDLYRAPDQQLERIESGWRLVANWNWMGERGKLLSVVRQTLGVPERVVAD